MEDRLTGALDEERARIERILDRLEVTEDLVERADLASELVRSASRYEDTLERSIWPLATKGTGNEMDSLVRDRQQLRDVMTVIHERTMHVDPRNVHAPDPQGFEDCVEDVVQRLRAIMEDEDRVLGQLDQAITDESQRQQIMTDVAGAYKHASERPKPPRTSIGRAIANVHVKLDHTLEDVATPTHPGSETIDG